MIIRLALSLLFALSLAFPAAAQVARVVPGGCGTANYGANFDRQLTMDVYGNLCITGATGGGGGSAYTVPFGSAIGSFGTPGGFKDGSGNFQPFTGTTSTGMDVNLKGTLPAFASNPTVVLNAETTKVIGTVRNVGSGGSAYDFAGQNATTPSIALLMGGQYNSTPTTITSGNASPFQLDANGNLKVNVVTGGGGGGGGLSVTDQAAFSAGSSNFTPGGGVYNDAATLSSGQQGTYRLTTKRAQVVDVDTSNNALYNALTSPSTALAATSRTTNTYTNGSTSQLNTNLNGNLYVDPGPLQAGSNTVGKVIPTDGTNSRIFDPCQTAARASVPITSTTSQVKVIIAGVSAKKTYICQIFLTSGAANNVGLFEATTGTTCATSPVAMIGAATTVATAANGMQFGAGGGVSLGSGMAQVTQTTVNNNDICIATSSAGPTSGVVTYVQQ